MVMVVVMEITAMVGRARVLMLVLMMVMVVVMVVV